MEIKKELNKFISQKETRKPKEMAYWVEVGKISITEELIKQIKGEK